MIAFIRGEVAQIALDRAVIVTGSGLGLEIYTTPQVLESLRLGQSAELHTELVVREDSLTLYGFASRDSMQAFKTLLSVKGIGPKLALAALAVYSPEQLALAVANKDYATLSRIPGVGRKSAERMVIEIGNKLGLPAAGSSVSEDAGSAASFNQVEVEQALVSLGWNAKAAEEALANIGPAADTATALRLALQYLGSKRG